MNTLMNNLKAATNYGYTENGAVKHNSTLSAVYDMFAFGGAYRNRSDEDCVLLFKRAYDENPDLAMKCLFYLRDVRGGQGERRFFRVCYHWLSDNHWDVAAENIKHVAAFGRWDDVIYSCLGTKMEYMAFNFIQYQLSLDVDSKTPSLLAKWLPSENASSDSTRKAATKIRKYLRMTHKQYRKTLSILRERINIVEKLMSADRWDEIEFDKIPSKAGLIYRNAFARRDMIAEKYRKFAASDDTKVNADALYPYDIVEKVIDNISLRYNYKNRTYSSNIEISDTERQMLQKYWDNQIDYFDGKECKMICVCDTSGSMCGRPMNTAIGLSMYCAERISGPFKGNYISFASRPQLISVDGVDFVDKVARIYQTNLCDNTNLTAVFELLKKASLAAREEDRLDTVVVISDMEIDCNSEWRHGEAQTKMEAIREEWEAAGLKCPRLVYWNVDARNDTILDLGPNVSLISGSSPVIFKQVVTGKTGVELMLEVLYSERYCLIKA